MKDMAMKVMRESHSAAGIDALSMALGTELRAYGVRLLDSDACDQVLDVAWSDAAASCGLYGIVDYESNSLIAWPQELGQAMPKELKEQN